MGESEHSKETVEDLPGDLEPEEQPSRPEQPDFDEAEREQYEQPPVERSIAEAEWPEDR